MVVVGLVLMVLGAAAVVAAVFTADGTAQLLGFDLSALAIFLVGLGAGLAIVWGFGFSKWGTKRTMRQRRETKKLNELSEQLDQRNRAEDAERNDRSV